MDLWNVALGFMDSQILLTAHARGVFALLDEEPREADAVAAAIGCPAGTTTRMLDALCAIGVLEKGSDGIYRNGPEAHDQLVPGRPGYMGAMFHHIRHALYPTWEHFEHAVCEGNAQWERAFATRVEAPPNETMYDDPEALRSFMAGMHGITYEAASAFAEAAPELGDVRDFVDVGGASGAFLIAVAERHHALRGTIVDLEPVRPIAEEYVSDAALGDRIRFQGADFWKDPIPEGADAYSLGFIQHEWEDDASEVILDRIAQAAPAGSLLAVGEYLWNEDRTGPLWVARSDLNMLVAARGRERSAAEYGESLRRTGFALERIQPTGHAKHYLLARRM